MLSRRQWARMHAASYNTLPEPEYPRNQSAAWLISKSNIPILPQQLRRLGFPTLRPGQDEAIRSLLNRRDTVFMAPTGSGKSAVYQIAASLMEGITIVVSPLIAPQKDLAEPALVNSTLAAAEQREQFERVKQGHAEFILLAPEQLHKEEIVGRLKSAGVALVAVDEAHCISQWGHDFRPEYLELARAIEALDHPPVLAMTATASNEARAEIIDRLGLRNPRVIVRGFDRPNINLRVDTFPSESEKLEAVLRRVEFADKPGIIDAATHHHAELIAEELRDRGVDALAYHGGMKTKDRDQIQNRFMNYDVPVIVADQCLWNGSGQGRYPIRLSRRRERIGGCVLPGDWARRARQHAR